MSRFGPIWPYYVVRLVGIRLAPQGTSMAAQRQFPHMLSEYPVCWVVIGAYRAEVVPVPASPHNSGHCHLHIRQRNGQDTTGAWQECSTSRDTSSHHACYYCSKIWPRRPYSPSIVLAYASGTAHTQDVCPWPLTQHCGCGRACRERSVRTSSTRERRRARSRTLRPLSLSAANCR